MEGRAVKERAADNTKTGGRVPVGAGRPGGGSRGGGSSRGGGGGKLYRIFSAPLSWLSDDSLSM